MTPTSLATITIVLSEVIVALLVVIYFVYRRYSKLKALYKNSAIKDNITDDKHKTDQKSVIAEYLKVAEENTSVRLDIMSDSNNEQHVSLLKRRHELLEAEFKVNNILSPDIADQAYWDEVTRIYAEVISFVKDEAIVTLIDEGKEVEALQGEIRELKKYKDLYNQTSEKLTEANEKISNLEAYKKTSIETEKTGQLQGLQSKVTSYKDLVDIANNKLKESSQTINDLNLMIEKDNSSGEKDEMASMIRKLKTNNNSLKGQLRNSLLPRESFVEKSLVAARKSKDEEISMYMDLIYQANEKLKKSSETINNFKDIIDNSTPSEELKQMEDMIENLSGENNKLLNELDSFKVSRDEDIRNDDVDLDVSVYQDIAAIADLKLNDSYKIIEELKMLVGNSSSAEELLQLEGMVEMLDQDNSGLRNQLEQIQTSSREKLAALQKEADSQQKELCEELTMYKSLVNQANEKLKESNATIEELKQKINGSENPAESKELQNLLDKLNEENRQLELQLQAVNNQLQVTLDNIQILDKQESDNVTQLKILKDEKWFLEEQVRHLTQQVTETRDSLQGKINSLEQSLKEKELQYELISRQL